MCWKFSPQNHMLMVFEGWDLGGAIGSESCALMDGLIHLWINRF